MEFRHALIKNSHHYNGYYYCLRFNAELNRDT